MDQSKLSKSKWTGLQTVESALEELKKFSLTALTAQTVEFMVSNVAYRATVYKTGTAILQYVVQWSPAGTNLIGKKSVWNA